MKRIKYNIKSLVFYTLILTIFTQCSSESPFEVEGEGLVRMNINVNSKITRSVEEEEVEKLLDNCKIYITNDLGVLHKWIGYQNIPSQGVYLRYGSYLAEAFAGDSVAASFEKKYYKGSTEFSLNSENPVAQVSINCKIANVVVSVDENSFDPEIFSELNIEVANSKGNLIFTKSNLLNRGYFMMPWKENKISYKITGKYSNGTEIEEILGVKEVLPAHEYRFKFQTDGENDKGGVLFNIEIEEYSLLEESDVIIYSKPYFSWSNGLPVGKQLVNTENSFVSETLCVGAYFGFKDLTLTTADSEIADDLGFKYKIVENGIENKNLSELIGKGITVTSSTVADGIYKYYITFDATWLNSLLPRGKEYVINVSATDKSPDEKNNTMKIRIANTNEAIVLEDPITFDINFATKDYTSVGARSVTIPIEISDELIDEYKYIAFQYRKESETSWITQEIKLTRSVSNVVLTGLEPSTSYVFRAIAGDKENDSYKFESEVGRFKTETEFSIPNYSMEGWYKNGKVWMPNAQGAATFWDTGNHGSTTISANDNLTVSTTNPIHTGQYAAQLTSKFVGVGALGKLGSGNLFVGEYAGTSGTNGKIDFGREYDASHPKKLRVWVNYRPAKAVKGKGADAQYIAEGQYDIGQIYIALSTEKKRVDTSDHKTFVNPNNLPSTFVAYGQHTFEGNFGEDDNLEMIEIPFEYQPNAKTTLPKYLIIVCSASKYGDYFSGGEGSTMIVDDFELVYE